MAAATSSIEVVPIVESVYGMPASPAAVAPAISPSVCIRRVNPVGAMPKGSSARGAEHVAAEVDLRDVAEDRRVQLDVAERLTGA